MQPGASVELIDERGVLQDALTMVGSGACVSIFTDSQHVVGMAAQCSDADDVLVSLGSDGAVAIQIKHRDALRADQRQLGERVHVAPETAFDLFLKSLSRVRVRTFVFVEGPADRDVLLAVFRPRADAQNQPPTSLRTWAEGTINRGMEQVHARIERLRAAGAIDADDRLQVEPPRDMKPGSSTDL